MARTVRFDLVVNPSRYARGLREAELANRGFGSGIRSLARDTDNAGGRFSKLAREVKKNAEPARVLHAYWSLLKWPLIASGINLATVAFQGLAAGSLEVVAGIAPLAGALPAVGVGALAVAQGVGVAKLAFGGIGPALKQAGVNSKKYAEELKKLPPAQQAIVKSLVPFKQQFIALKNIAAEDIAPGFIAGMKAALPLMGTMRNLTGYTASALGGLAKAAGQVVGSRLFRRDFSALGRGNVEILRNLGRAAIALIQPLMSMARAAQPLARWMSELALIWAQSIAQWVAGARASGALTRFFKLTETTISTLVDTIGRFAHALGPVFSAALPGGQTFLQLLRDGAAMFDRWTHSARGASAIASMFKSGNIVLAALGNLVKSIWQNFKGLNDQVTATGFAGLIDKVSKTAVPAFAALAKSASKQFIDNIVLLATNILRILATIAGDSGTLNSFVGVMARLAGVTATLVEKVPGMDKIVIAVGTLAGIGKATGLGALATGFNQVYLKALLLEQTTGKKTFMLQGINALKSLGSSAASAAGSMVAAAGRVVWAWAQMAAKALVNAARIAASWLIAMGPIGWAIAAIIAVGAAFVVLWKKSETFRNIARAAMNGFLGAVQAVWNWIKGNWPLLLGILTGPLGLAVVVIIRNWDKIRSAAGVAFGAIGGAAKATWKFITDRFNDAKNLIVRLFGDIGSFALRIFRFLVDSAFNAVMGILHLFGKLPGPLGAPFRAAESAVKNAKVTVDRQLDGMQARINKLTGKDIPVSASLKLNFSSSFTQQDWAQVKVLTRGQKGLRIPGYGGGDTVPLLAERGETLVSKEASRLPYMVQAFRAARVPGYQAGGPIGTIDAEARAINKVQARGTAMIMDRGLTKMLNSFGMPAGSASVNKVAQWTAAVFHRMGEWMAWARRIMSESGGNWAAVNRWDSNWYAGTPSVGGAQVIGPTFRAYAGKFRNVGPFMYGVSINPYANSYAGAAYAISRYGSMAAVDPLIHPGGYARGAWKIARDRLAMVHAGEMILPKGPAETVRRGGAPTVPSMTMIVNFNGQVDDPEAVQRKIDESLNRFAQKWIVAQHRGGRV